MSPKPTLRAAIYARYSSDKQREASIEDQLRRCRDYAAREGYEVRDEHILTDHAISGASTANRGGFDALMALAHEKPRRIDIILTESTDRLSRDLADATTTFKRLAFLGVRFVSVADGIDTANKSAKMQYAFKALMAETFIDDLRDKTKRGLDGRALAGFATGGQPYGYFTREEKDTRGNVVGHSIHVDDEQAALVRRIFTLYTSGFSPAGIARLLNSESLAAPRTRIDRKPRGWVGSTIREMLRNERYIGIYVFNRNQFIKDPDTGRRVARRRPENEIMRLARPDERIVPEALWEAAQARIRAVSSKYTPDSGPRIRAYDTPHLLSGLLVCGHCGAPMSVIGGGNTARYYRCDDHRKRGTCTNKRSVREDLVRTRVFEALRAALSTPEMLHGLRARVASYQSERQRSASTEREELRARIAKAAKRIETLVSQMADGNAPASVVDHLRVLEADKLNAERALETTQHRETTTILLPTPQQMLGIVERLEELLTRNVTTGREALRSLLKGGVIALTDDDGYVATSEILALRVFLAEGKPDTTTPSAESSGTAPLFDIGCGGRI